MDLGARLDRQRPLELVDRFRQAIGAPQDERQVIARECVPRRDVQHAAEARDRVAHILSDCARPSVKCRSGSSGASATSMRALHRLLPLPGLHQGENQVVGRLAESRTLRQRRAIRRAAASSAPIRSSASPSAFCTSASRGASPAASQRSGKAAAWLPAVSSSTARTYACLARPAAFCSPAAPATAPTASAQTISIAVRRRPLLAMRLTTAFPQRVEAIDRGSRPRLLEAVRPADHDPIDHARVAEAEM